MTWWIYYHNTNESGPVALIYGIFICVKITFFKCLVKSNERQTETPHNWMKSIHNTERTKWVRIKWLCEHAYRLGRKMQAIKTRPYALKYRLSLCKLGLISETWFTFCRVLFRFAQQIFVSTFNKPVLLIKITKH